ncbi:MAG: HAD family hydrolase [Crenarchaeota archaeon]|nr:HAD family hydrolase [Thermoproteota archaeon]
MMREELGKEMKFLEFLSRFHATPIFWRLHKALELLELEACENMEVYSDAKAFLEEAQGLAERLVIVTMQSASACLRALEKLGLEDRVCMCVSREVAPTRLKQLAYVIHSLGLDPRKTLFVGDKVIDGFAASYNGLSTVVVLRNPRCRAVSDTDDIIEDLLSAGVVVVESLEQAIPIVKRLAQRTI